MSMFRRPLLPSLLTLLAVTAAAPRLCAQPAAAPAAAGDTAAGLPKVPPVPEGTPQQLLEFVEGLKQSNARPKSREEMMAWMKEVAGASRQAADKILAQVQPGQKFHDEAATLKLESLMMLGRMGDEQAAADMAAYAKSLVNSPSAELAKEAKRLVLVSDAQQLLSSGKLDGGPALVQNVAGMLAADPDDPQTAGLAMQLANAFEHVPGGEPLAMLAYKSFGPLFAKSQNEQIRSMGESSRPSWPGMSVILRR